MERFMKFVGVGVVILILLGLVSVWASETISLNQAVDMGLSRSSAFKVATFTLMQNEVTYKQSKANLLLQPSILSELEIENVWRNANRNFEVQKSAIALRVEELYYNQLKAERTLVLSQENLKRAEKQLENIQTKFSLGTVAKIDLLKSELEVENARLEVKRAEKNLHIAQAELASYLVGDTKKVFTLSTQLTFEPLDLDLERCIAYALANRPEIKTREEALSLSRKAVEVTRAPYYPSLEVEKARASLQLAEVQLEDTRNAIVLEVERKFVNFVAALDSVPVAQKSQEIARENLNVAQARFDAGVLTVVDLLSAQNNLYEAESNYLNAIFNYNMSKAQLYQALGINVAEREKYTQDLLKEKPKPKTEETPTKQ
ncbi:MAG: TolC family protein [Atribacterota bacterium]